MYVTILLNLLCLFLEKLFAKSKEEYEWLQQSTFNFPGKEELKCMFEESWFHKCKST